MEGDEYIGDQSGYSAIAMTNINSSANNKSIRLTDVVPVGNKGKL
jgi:hypothetical protein